MPDVSPNDAAATRSPVLNEFRANPFRVLRLPAEAGPDDAVWRAEELSALARAGVPCETPDPIPWLPPADEADIRHAVQAAEEPLRRLLARLSWFDFENDPNGDLLRRAVATLSPDDVAAYRAAPTLSDPLPPPPPPPPVPVVRTGVPAVSGMRTVVHTAAPPLPGAPEPGDDGLSFSESLRRLVNNLDKPREASPASTDPTEDAAFDVLTDRDEEPTEPLSQAETFAKLFDDTPEGHDLFGPNPDWTDGGGTPPVKPVPATPVAADVLTHSPPAAVPQPARPAARPASREYRGSIQRVNRANLQLLVAACVPGAPEPGPAGARAADWSSPARPDVVVNPHTAVAGTGEADRARVVAAWWGTAGGPGALWLWTAALKAPTFADFAASCLAELGDEIVGPDSADEVTRALWTRLTDLVAGELKVQLEEGRTGRAAALLAAAGASGIEPRRWALPLRAVRPRFKAELAELDPLLGTTPHHLDDVALYLDRTAALSRRWAALDPGGLLGLREATDEAVLKALDALSARRDFGSLPRVIELQKRAAEVATAHSVKQRAASSAAQAEEQSAFGCHFCRARDAEYRCGVVLRGSKITHSTRSGNTITNHILITFRAIPRCARCEELHHFTYWLAIWWWVAVAAPAAVLGLALARTTFAGVAFLGGVIALAAYVGGFVGLGFVCRWAFAGWATPSGERRYWDSENSPQYRELAREQFTITTDYTKGAVGRAIAEQSGLSRR